MDQHWQLVNVDKGEKSRVGGGTLSEMFFGQQPVAWIYLLAVPATPPGRLMQSNNDDTVAAGSWVGDRIILVGDHAKTWPQDLLTQADYQRIGIPFPPDHDAVESFVARCREVVTASPRREGLYPIEKLWVLRNLTKREYVRANGLPTLHGGNRGDSLMYHEDGSLEGYPGLAYVLPSRLGWSQDPSASLDLSEQMQYHLGDWAGDRFDAQLWEELEDELLYNGWSDVSRREAIRIDAMWKGKAYLDNPQALAAEPPWIQE